MSTQVLERAEAAPRTRLRIVDCDVPEVSNPLAFSGKPKIRRVQSMTARST